MRPTELLQEIRKMRFEEAYEGWQASRLTQMEAARLLGVCIQCHVQHRRISVTFHPMGRRVHLLVSWLRKPP